MLNEASYIAKIALILAACVTMQGPLSAKIIAQKPDIFASVPEKEQSQLKARLAVFVLYHQEKDWIKVYELLGSQYKNAWTKPADQDEFVKKRLYSSIEKFTPSSVQRMDEGWWMIWGCGTFRNGGQMTASLEAYFENGSWYFSDIWSVAPCIDCKPDSCKHKSKNQLSSF
jgi:hypothetical protein